MDLEELRSTGQRGSAVDEEKGPELSLPPPMDRAPMDRNRLSNPRRPGLGSRSSSATSVAQVESMISDEKVDTETFGINELRDGFFDAMYLKQTSFPAEDISEDVEDGLPEEFKRVSYTSPGPYLSAQWKRLRFITVELTTTRAGIRLVKAFLAFFVAYILCLVPSVRGWLGRYHYVMPLSVILNHPSRTIGSQLDGAVLTIAGTAAGLGWGAIALLLSTSTLSASTGYGGILALFLALFMTATAWIRSFFIRFYQGALCAGIAITFTCLAETNSRDVEWAKLRSYGIPWVLGQAIALLVNCLIFPDAGARPLAKMMHEFFGVAQSALVVPRPRDLRIRRNLSKCYIDVAQAYRDMGIDVTVTRFRPEDVRDLRYLMQDVVRALLSMETETYMFDDLEPDDDSKPVPKPRTVTVKIDAPSPPIEPLRPAPDSEDATRTVIQTLSGPTKDMLRCMGEGLSRSDAALMELSGYRKHLGPPKEVSADIAPIQIRLKACMASFAAMESTLLSSSELPPASIQDSDVVRLFVFARHVREAASTVQKLLVKVNYMQHTSDWPKVHLPSYPFWKAIHRTNAQVRHDRGGITAGSYHSTFKQIGELLDKMAARKHEPLSRLRENTSEATSDSEDEPEGFRTATDSKLEGDAESDKVGVGYNIWRVLHRLQGLESRYAFKVCLVCSLLSVPSYLGSDQGWWDRYEVWWAVSMSWIMLHPRVGGNLQDLCIRGFSAILGAAWSGAAIAAGNGNPYVLAAFAAVYMLPMMWRFTQSAHPRSGLVGCFSFTVISLGLQSYQGDTATSVLAVIKGLSFFVGTTVPIIVNWFIWPFVARHELRYALSSMLFFMSIMYRNVVAKYVYYQAGRSPTESDVRHSEMLEGRLREGFVRVRQLLVLTRHELRLRAAFDPVPYSALAGACERFFDYVVAVRQSALFYEPDTIRDNREAAEKLLGYRRDAVAAILGNLYILAGALRSQRKVPRYLPSAVAARKRFLVRIAELEQEEAASSSPTSPTTSPSTTSASASGARRRVGGSSSRNLLGRRKKWSDIYSYSYNESLTGCVAQLEELEKYTKLIVGEQGFGDEFHDDEDDDDDNDEEADVLRGHRYG